MSNTTTTEKEYQITLTVGELETIRHLLTALGEFFELLKTFKIPINIGIKLDGIDGLDEKIFKQYYDEDGEFR